MIDRFIFISVLILVLLFLAFMVYLAHLRPDMLWLLIVADAIVIWWAIIYVALYFKR